jgi:hypothetical protein
LRCSVTVAVVILLRAIGRYSGERLESNLGGFFARLVKVTVVAPQVCTILASLYNHTAGPRRPDPCTRLSKGERKEEDVERTSRVGVVLELRLGDLVGATVVWRLEQSAWNRTGDVRIERTLQLLHVSLLSSGHGVLCLQHASSIDARDPGSSRASGCREYPSLYLGT